MEPQSPLLDFLGHAHAEFRLLLKRTEGGTPLAVFEVTLPGSVVLTAQFEIEAEAFSFHGVWDSHKLLDAGWGALAVTLGAVQERVNNPGDPRIAMLEKELSDVRADRDRLLGQRLGIRLG